MKIDNSLAIYVKFEGTLEINKLHGIERRNSDKHKVQMDLGPNNIDIE